MPSGATIDLIGGTLRLLEDESLSCFRITDTSAGHDGTVEMEEGSSIAFDDTRGAGFGSEASAMTLQVDGSISKMARIGSESIKPRYPWKLPPKAASVLGDFGQMVDAQGFKGLSWNVTSFEFVDTRSMRPGAVGRLKEVVTIELWDGTYDSYAKRQYSAPVAVKCYIVREPAVIIDAQGREAVSSVQVHVDGVEEVEETSRLTLPGGQQPVIKKVEVRTGPGGMPHKKVMYA